MYVGTSKWLALSRQPPYQNVRKGGAPPWLGGSSAIKSL